MIRKFNRANRLVLALFSALSLTMFGAMAFSAQRTAASVPAGIELPAGSVIYDNAYVPVELAETGLVQRRTTGQYVLTQGESTLPLGAHTLAYTGNALQVFGGGYLVESDGSVSPVEDTMVFDALDAGAVIKMADRRYVMAGASISDSNNVFTAERYIYIVMDIVGNARLLSQTMSLRTTQPTTLRAGNLSFDIANEELTLGDQGLALDRLIGSTNTYDSGIYKTIDHPQTPDEINVTIRGGAGGA
ncbi:MAG: hypothetical protein IJQ98_13710, partial [Oscillospiraceae bacterium]|nr:hypothetical protein [Oscillospiraceae bacterium]